MTNFGAVSAHHRTTRPFNFASLAKCSPSSCPSSRTRIYQYSGCISVNWDAGRSHCSNGYACTSSRFSGTRDPHRRKFHCSRLVSARNGVQPALPRQDDSSLDREDGNSKGRGLFSKMLEDKDESVGRVENNFLKLPVFYFTSALLALGLCFSFCKPAVAKTAERPPTVTATLNEKGEVELQDREREPGEGKDNLDKSGEENGEFEPAFGEGSDLTTDPTEILLRSYLERHPGDLKALQALLFMRLKKGQVNAAMPVVEKLIEMEPDQLEWKFIRAQGFEFVGDLEQAREAFDEILKLRPLSARALQGLAVVMQKSGEEEQALQLLTEAVKSAVDSGRTKEVSNIRMLLGQMHTIQGNLDEAMEQYRTVVEEDPEDYRPYLCQGLVYSIIGEEAEAEKQFKRYKKLCPKDFPHRGFLNELMLQAKSESRKLNKRLKKEEELKAKGKKIPKPMRQPLASGGATMKEETVEK
ncbi:hypothetical protein R1sor_013123 [Riccia sorocarpa]|uniref:Uncharacterized protein n=1 Tax=Riccia sorocarpa TaxID=122646 RepID=A0ABD3H9K1_9MARC